MRKIIILLFLITAFLYPLSNANAATIGDINGDGIIALEEAINALQVMAGIRGGFSNDILLGTWISIGIQSDNAVYAIFNGNGIITEFGAFRINNPAGTYQVNSNGAVSMTINTPNGTLGPFNGNLISSNELQWFSGRLVKVADTAACQGTWSGTWTAQGITPPPPSPNIQFNVDNNGTVTSFSGLASPVVGKMFCESNNAVAHFKTAQSNSYREIVFNGALLYDNTLLGYYFVDNGSANDPDGTFTLKRQ